MEKLSNPTSVLPAAFARPLSRCDPCFFHLPLLHCYCADDPASVAYPCLERQCMSKRQGKLREIRVWNVWTWLKNASGSRKTPSEEVVNK